MKIKVLYNDSQSLKECLEGKKRIMTYGAGVWADTIKKMLKENGYSLDYAIVDDAYYANCGNVVQQGGGTGLISMEKLVPPCNSKEDALIWAIGSPDRLRICMEDDESPEECFLIWEMGFWEDRNYFYVHREEFQKAGELLCDEYSKKVFRGYLKAIEGDLEEDLLYSTNGTYFNELTRKRREGAFLDCGSYDGQSALDYMKFIGEECRVYAFEPDKENFQNLTRRMQERPDVICLNKGCYSSEKMLSFCSAGDMSSCLQEDGTECVEVTTIDRAVGDEKVAFIKMDVEGAELEALKGAEGVIARDMPVLAISAYHRQEDLITLLPYISSLHSQKEHYQLYLRHHGVVQAELVLYAIPVERKSLEEM